MADIRYALRMMRRTPGFTAVAVLSLTLGIGANTAIFSIVNTLLLRPLPVHDPAQLVELLSQYPDPTEPPHNGYPWKYFERFRDQTHVFTDVVGISPTRVRLGAEGIDAEAVDGEYVTGNLFHVLGVRPAVGRLLTSQDDQIGSPNAAVAVLSWSSWSVRFGRDPAVVGRRIIVDGVEATVIGVTPPEFLGLRLGAAPEVWLPVAMEPLIQRPSRRISGELAMGVVARMKPGVTRTQARAEIAVLDRDRIEEIAKRGDRRWLQTTVDVAPASSGVSTELHFVYRTPLLALMAIVGVLLLITITNVASLLLARGVARQRELAVRVSLGAGRVRLVRLVLAESLLIAAAGCVLGIVVAYASAGALVGVISSGRIIGLPPRFQIPLHLDVRVLLFTVSVSALAGVLFGLAPAWIAWSVAPVSTLRATGAAADTPSRRLLGKGLVVAQVALSVVLLSAAGLFVRHMFTLRNVGLGFQRDSVLLVTLDSARSGYEPAQLAPLYRQLLERFAAIPGVRAATLSGTTPVSGAGASRFIEVPGVSEKAEQRRRVALNWTAPKYFETLGMRLLAGRDFRFDDQGGPLVAIVSQSTARYYFGDRSPIGQFFTFDRQDNRGTAQDRPYQIVGVVGDAKYLNLQEPLWRLVYLNAFQEPRVFAHQFSLRTSVRPETLTGEVRRAVRDVLKTVTVARVTTLTDQVDASMIPERLTAMLSGFFGGLGLLLAAIGLYGLLAYTVARRTNEIGIRMALGATHGDVMRMVQKSALALVFAGIAIGVPLAFVAARFAVTFADNIGLPAIPIAAAAITLIIVALVAAYLPARRASRVNPLDALRAE
jgi:putative ABC transport system permease protein